MEAKKLTKKDLWKVFRGQLTIRGANNYERQQDAGFTLAMMPGIEKDYDNDEDIPVGIAAAMEEMHANDPDMDPNAINAVKTALMGPLAGLGDSLLNGTARPILASLAISLVHANLGWVGPIFFVIGMSIVSLGIRYLGVIQGYKQGIKLVEKINSSGLISKITDIAAIAAYTIVGGFIPALVVMNIPIEIKSGETVINIQKTLDGLMPGVLGLAYTFLMYYLVTKKKISAVKLIFFTMVFAILAVYAGILG